MTECSAVARSLTDIALWQKRLTCTVQRVRVVRTAPDWFHVLPVVDRLDTIPRDEWQLLRLCLSDGDKLHHVGCVVGKTSECRNDWFHTLTRSKGVFRIRLRTQVLHPQRVNILDVCTQSSDVNLIHNAVMVSIRICRIKLFLNEPCFVEPCLSFTLISLQFLMFLWLPVRRLFPVSLENVASSPEWTGITGDALVLPSLETEQG